MLYGATEQTALQIRDILSGKDPVDYGTLGMNGATEQTFQQIRDLMAGKEPADLTPSSQLTGVTEQTLLEIKELVANGGFGDVPDSFLGITMLVREGNQGKYFRVGDQLVPVWTDGYEYENPFDIVELECSPELPSGEIVHGMMIQQHYATTRGCPFDAQEALYDAVDGLPAGTYHFTVAGDTWMTSENGKVLQFTLTKPIPAGGQLVYANTEGYNQVLAGQKINTYAAPDNFTAIESVVLSEGDGGTDLGTTDGKGDLNHHQRAFRGCGRWKTSMLRQYLNSDKPAGQWWTKQDKWDRASTFITSCPGYMAGFEPEFLAAIKRVKVDTARDTVVYDGGTDTTYDYFFPVSLEQMNIAPQAAGIEGESLAYWEDVAAAYTTGKLDTNGRFKQYETYPDLIHYGLNAKTTARNCWLRSALCGGASGAWIVYSSGSVNSYGAFYCSFCAPACVIC